MTFFDDPAPAPEDPQQRYIEPHWRRIPAERLPVPLGVSATLAQTDLHAIVLHQVVVYPTGITFEIRTVRHPEDETDAGVMRNVIGPPRPADGGLQVGVAWDDGRRATNDPYRGWSDDDDAPTAHLHSNGATGADWLADSSFWAWPLPDEGDLTVVVAWPAKGITDQTYRLSGDELRAAAARSVELWPGATAPER